jgi:8-oxo-dGTP pyrophosphatase MutT (NUDIX family)
MGAGVMLLCGDKTLVLRRAEYKSDRWSGYLNFPGGQGEPNETTYQTALRETEEETGITPDQYKVVDHVEDKIYTMYVGVCKTEIVPVLDHEHTEWEWIVISKIPSMTREMHPKDWRGFKKYYRL